MNERLRIVSDELWQRVKARQEQQADRLGTRVIGGLRKNRSGAGRPSKYMLSGLLRCSECHGGFVLASGVRYHCASHVNGGDAACKVILSVPRYRVEKLILDFTEHELPRILTEAEARYTQQPVIADPRPRIAELERQIANFVKMIGAGEFSPAVSAALKAAETELAGLKVTRPRPAQKASREPIERRVKRMRDQLAKGGDTAQAILRELFPSGFLLYPDPNGGRFLWAHARTAVAADWESKLDERGHLPGEHWPRIYDAETAAEADRKFVVAGACLWRCLLRLPRRQRG